MPTKKQQRKAYEKARKAAIDTPNLGQYSSNFVPNVEGTQKQTNQNSPQYKNTQNDLMDENFSTPSVSSSKKRGRPQKTLSGKHNKSHQTPSNSKSEKKSQNLSTPRTSRLVRINSISPPLPKKGKSSESLTIQNILPTNQIAFDELTTIQFAQQKKPNCDHL